MKYKITQSRLLYVMSIDDRKHKGLLKVGEVFVDNEIADSNDKQLYNNAIREILDSRSYMHGVGSYRLEYVECTTYEQNTKCYKADDVHRTLRKMEVPSKMLGKIKGNEVDIWFACFVDEVKEAIKKIKNGCGAGHGDIKFRPEQEQAIDDTVSYFKREFKDEKKGKSFLWNAKMRFGKTLSGLEVAKRMDYKSTLIITHRPVVDEGWHDDFNKIFGNDSRYTYATRMSDYEAEGGDFYHLTRSVDNGGKRLVFFVSMQYLRLSQFVDGKEKNFDPLKKAIMMYDWDFVMVDEAHEGIEATAGVRVMDKLRKDNTRILSLSGTPFNLLDKYDESEIYTWDYVMEQKAKQEWDDKHFGDPNPYADLPCMQILTFTFPKMLRDAAIENNEFFRFHEFFRVWTEDDIAKRQRQIDEETNALKKVQLQAQLAEVHVGKFVLEGAVKLFLDKLIHKSDTSQYPFSTKEFRDKFRHTFWILPGVKEAAALEQLLLVHPVFGVEKGQFKIINAAGDGNIEDKDGSALSEVLDNIRGNKDKNISAKARTITLSCGKLTTGVSVPEWTAVLCMKGSENTPAANYMQTIFRVQTHAILNGRQKSDCYVFDFAPDRALTAVAETSKMAVYAQTERGKGQLKLSQAKEEEHLEAFIKLCPVLSMDEGEMGRNFTANQIFEKLSNVYIERAVRSGYADNSLYNPEQLMNLTPEQEKALGDVHDLLGSMPNNFKPEKININNNGIGNTEGADQMKYIYYLTANNVVPERPTKAEEMDENGCPTTHDDEWSDVMSLPTALFRYLYVSSSKLVDNEWTDFSNPVLWKEYSDAKRDDNDAKKQRDEENKEKRARMSVLRGVSIRIPLLVYGAEINDDAGEEITIDNFASEEIVDQASWDEFMPKGFTKETFNILKDCFDRSIFTGAAKRIRAMVKEADNLSTEDRIDKIATIFSYFHNPDKETVLTPWRVVNMQLSDTLGGWCFYNEQFDAINTIENECQENIKFPRFVDRGDVTKDVFTDYNSRILEINSKTGLYPLYMAYSLFKEAKEPAYREFKLTGERGRNADTIQYNRQAGNDLEIWKDVLQDNIFVVCRTKMAVSITKRTLAGFRNDIRMNVKFYEREVSVNDLVTANIYKTNDELITKNGKTYFYDGKESLMCDMINALIAKSELFNGDVIRGHDFWHVYNAIPKSNNEDINNMKFKAIVGNPPYQLMDGGNNASAIPVYNLFVNSSKAINPDYISMIMPARWCVAGRGLDDFRNSMLHDQHLRKIFDFKNGSYCFPGGIRIGGGVCYFLWDTFFNSNDIQIINMPEYFEQTRPALEFDLDFLIRSNVVRDMVLNINRTNTEKLSSLSWAQKPFGFRTNYDDFKLSGEVKLYTKKSKSGIGYVTRNDVTKNAEYIDDWQVVTSRSTSVPEEDNGQVLRQVQTFISEPGSIVTESYIVVASFKERNEAENCLKYLKTKFFRILCQETIVSPDVSARTFDLVPLQNFTFSSDIDWSKSISDISQQLYNKYNISSEEITFIEKLIKPME